MLWEALQWLTTPCPDWARGTGMLHASIALGARGRRCAGAWHDHLQRVRGHIEAVATGGDCAVVLGSGWLHDVPIAHLLTAYRRVVLVDAVHPRPVRALASRHPGLVLAEVDLSGVLAGLWAGRHRPVVLAEPLAPPWSAWLPGPADLVVSDLVLSQVAMTASAFAVARGADPEATAAWAARIQAHHLASLPPGRRQMLITDTEVRWGAEMVALVAPSLLPPARDSWVWQVAPPGEQGDAACDHQVVVAEL
jgi:hypothetical protein